MHASSCVQLSSFAFGFGAPGWAASHETDSTGNLLSPGPSEVRLDQENVAPKENGRRLDKKLLLKILSETSIGPRVKDKSASVVDTRTSPLAGESSDGHGPTKS
jgi:hypothetical protein